MSELVADCPRCGSKQITFDVTQQHLRHLEPGSSTTIGPTKYHFEIFCICRRCNTSTVFQISNRVNVDSITRIKDIGILNMSKAVNIYFDIDGFVCIKNVVSKKAPPSLPENIERTFNEGASCEAIDCYNAAGSMFRLCLDLASKELLNRCIREDSNLKPNNEQRNKLFHRLEWLFESEFLPNDLKELSKCVRDDGNDAAHDGSINKVEAEDLLDFTYEILRRIYSDPDRIKKAIQRTKDRRENNS